MTEVPLSALPVDQQLRMIDHLKREVLLPGLAWVPVDRLAEKKYHNYRHFVLAKTDRELHFAFRPQGVVLREASGSWAWMRPNLDGSWEAGEERTMKAAMNLCEVRTLRMYEL